MIDFRLDEQAVHRTHTVMAAAPAVHSQLRALVLPDAGRTACLPPG